MSTISTIRNQSQGIIKTKHEVSVGTLHKWYKIGAVDSADWNRSKVDNHIGTPQALMESMMSMFSISMMLAFINCVITSDRKLHPTPENKLNITDGGHRLRWIIAILDDLVTVDGKTFSELKIIDAEMYNRILNYQITIEVITHVSGTVPESYAKKEYNGVNTHGEPLKLGEVLRASTEDNFHILKSNLSEAYSHRAAKMNALIRDGATALYAVIISAMASNNFDLLTTTSSKKTTVEVTKPLNISDDMKCNINNIITSIKDIENWVFEKFGSLKHGKTALSSSMGVLTKALDLKLHGPMIYGLYNSANTDERNANIANIKKFYEISLVNKETMDSKFNYVMQKKAGGNGGNRLGKQFHADGWARIKSVVNPVTTGHIADADVVSRLVESA
jgi:hypothetical protein